MNIKFSIIMPCYNSEAYVKNAIDSIINQTYDNWEFIIVNDGSNDNTLSIINNYAVKDNRIKVLSKENGGYCSAVNLGLDNITGDYFLMLGSDDRLECTLFKKLNDEVNEKKPDIVSFRAIKFNGNERIGVDENSDFKNYIFSENNEPNIFYGGGVKEVCFFAIRDTAKIYKTSLLGNLRYFGECGIDADGAFSSLFSHKAKSYMVLPIEGYFWTIRIDSLSSLELSYNLKYDVINVWYLYFSYLINNNVDINNFMDIFFCEYLFNLVKKISTSNPFSKILFRKKVLYLIKKIYKINNRKTSRTFKYLSKFLLVFSICLKLKKLIKHFLKKY